MSSDEFLDMLRVRPQERQQLLDALDAASKARLSEARRAAQRLEYRADRIQLCVTHPGGTLGRFYVKARNLSSGGLSFIHGGFLHVGTECRVLLTAINGEQTAILGKVRSCRFIKSNVHEIGIEFFEKLDVLRFVSPQSRVTSKEGTPAAGSPARPNVPSLQGDALVVSCNAVEQKSIAEWLRRSGMNVVGADCIGAALDQLKRLPIDVLVCVDSVDVTTMTSNIAMARSAGYKGAVIAVTNAHGSAPAAQLDPGGVCAVLARPLEMLDLIACVRTLAIDAQAAAIQSELDAASNSGELIAFFVEQARAAARELGDALATNNIEDARKSCRVIKGNAAGYGFPGIAEAARQADASLERATELADAGGHVLYLVSLLKRVKSGYAPPRAA